MSTKREETSSAGGAGLGPALVTGAARRIGLAIAARLAQQGRPVVLHASHRSAEEAELAAQAIRARGGRAAVAAADLSVARETEALVEFAARQFGPITLLVNNASLFELDSAEDFSVETFDRQLAVDLRAPLLLARDMAARLPEGVDGAIVNLLDQRVFRPTPRYFTYTLAKSALWTATRTMAQSFAPRIRVNAVGPGPVFPNAVHGQKGFEAEARGVPLKHAADVAGVVDAVVFLAEAKSVTGQMIAVDAGQHLAWETPDVLPD
ncbi:SDR family oxidoreductase [Methylosinus sp. Sm6]|uniref:SDR family oxidoreductase n=1 Tax=Methylosinus sp. Sm6 TaxID=2866948 RepID=UPI001C98EB78|nr:SDR family oxidoreductase [Methylosinus sp. Sm6]